MKVSAIQKINKYKYESEFEYSAVLTRILNVLRLERTPQNIAFSTGAVLVREGQVPCGLLDNKQVQVEGRAPDRPTCIASHFSGRRNMMARMKRIKWTILYIVKSVISRYSINVTKCFAFEGLAFSAAEVKCHSRYKP